MTSLIRHSLPGVQRRPPRPTLPRDLATWILRSDRAQAAFSRALTGQSKRLLREEDSRRRWQRSRWKTLFWLVRTEWSVLSTANPAAHNAENCAQGGGSKITIDKSG